MARRVRVEGKGRVLANLDRVFANTPSAAMQSIRDGAEVGRNAARKRTPVETGHLRRSYVISAQTAMTGAIAVLANTAEYAARVHENVEEKLRGVPRPGSRPGRHWDGGEAKFLEKGVFENKSAILSEVVTTARRVLFRGL